MILSFPSRMTKWPLSRSLALPAPFIPMLQVLLLQVTFPVLSLRTRLLSYCILSSHGPVTFKCELFLWYPCITVSQISVQIVVSQIADFCFPVPWPPVWDDHNAPLLFLFTLWSTRFPSEFWRMSLYWKLSLLIRSPPPPESLMRLSWLFRGEVKSSQKPVEWIISNDIRNLSSGSIAYFSL